MLDDVGAEKVSIGQGIDRRDQIEKKERDARKEIRRAMQAALAH